MEIVKLICCAAILLSSHIQARKKSVQHGFSEVILECTGEVRNGMMKMLIPAAIYALQNNLLFVALSNLDSTTFQVTYQLKILTTALFMVTMMGRRLSRRKWVALALLMIGVAVVQIETLQKPIQAVKPLDQMIADAPLDHEETDMLSRIRPSVNTSQTIQNPIMGVLAVLAACVSSGFAGTYFEKIVKRSNTSLWARNVQLGLFGTLFSVIACFQNDGTRIGKEGFFTGYTFGTVLIVMNQALGGIVVALVVKYADNLLKGFSTCKVIIYLVLSFILTALQQCPLYLVLY